MDENVHGAITSGLRQRHINVLIAQEDIPEGTPDPAVLDRATELGRVLFTQDDDLLAEAARRQRMGEPFAGVIYIHQDKLIIGRCIEDLELLTQVSEPEQFVNYVQYLPLR